MAQNDYVIRLRADDNLSPAIRNAQASLKDLGKAAPKLEDIQKNFNRITNSSAPLGRRIRDIKGQMEKLATSGELASKEGQEMWNKLAEAAREYDETLKKIKADTGGITIPAADTSKGFDAKSLASGIADKFGLGGVSSQIGSALANPYVLAASAIAGASKALYDYNAELERTLDRTAQFTGLSGDALMQLRNGIQSVATTFGKDFNTVLSSVDGMMNQFHIDGEEALKIIRNGFIGGADDSGRMLEMIAKYSGAFHDAGISASELVAIIGNTRSGIFSEAGMDLIQMSAKKIREMSKSTQSSLDAIGISSEKLRSDLQSGAISTMDAIQMISDRLKDLPPQSEEVGAVLKDVFGRQGSNAGIELVTALSEVETNLDKVKEQTGQWGEAMERLEKADREMENALAALFGVADGGFSTMSIKLKAEVYGAVARVINGFIDWYNQSLMVRGAVSYIAMAFKNAWEVIKVVLKLSFDSLKGMADMMEGVFSLDWDKVKSGWNKGVKSILQTVASGFENMKENAATAVEQTLNGQIKKIEVPVEPVYSDVEPIGGDGNGSGDDGDDGDDKKKKTKTKEPKEEKVYDESSIKYAQQMVQKLRQEFEEAPEALRPALEASLKYWEEELKKRRGETLPVKPQIPEGSLKDLQDQLKKVTEDLTLIDPSDAQGVEELTSKYKELTEQIKELSVALGLQKGEDPLKDKKDSAKEYQKQLQETYSAIGSMGSAFASLGSAIDGAGGEMLAFVGKTAEAIAQLLPQILTLITAKEGEAIAGAAASGAGIGFPQNIAAIAAGVAAVASIFAAIPKFATGGIVPGSSFIGDKTLIRANAGEMVLNQGQQNNLYQAIKNNDLGSPSLSGSVRFEIDGGKLVGVLNNYNSKSRRQS